MAEVDNFSKWLSCKLLGLRIDDSDNVYGSYIRGILDSDDSYEEKIEAMDGLISGVCDQEVFNITALCKEVLDEWAQFVVTKNPSRILDEAAIDSKLKQLLESQSLSTTTLRERSNEQLKVKEAILNQYNQISDDEEDDCAEVGDSQRVHIQKNTNSQVVAQTEKDKRQQAKIESQKKKDKDKEDREKQKQMKEERKEKVKRKAQKVERKK